MVNNDWYESIEREISSLKEKMNSSDYELYELELLLRVAKRVASFSSGCDSCQGHCNEISHLVTNLGNLPNMTQGEVSSYGTTFRSILEHLRIYHGLHRPILILNPVIPLVIGLPIFIAAFILIAPANDLGDPRVMPAFVCFLVGSFF